MQKITRNEVECAYKSIPALNNAIDALNAIDTGCVNHYDDRIVAVDYLIDVLNDSKKEHEELLSYCKSRQSNFDRNLLNKIYGALYAAQDGATKYDREKQFVLDAYHHQAEALKAKGFDSKQIEQIAPYPHVELSEMADQQIERLALISKLSAFVNSPDYDVDLLSDTIFEEAV